LPAKDEWDVLSNFVGGSSVEGRYLKAISGWNGNGNGLDTYGFAALPGGYGRYGGGFYGDVGGCGYWWSATEYDSVSAYSRSVGYSREGTYWNYGGKSDLFSVRYLQD
jgi:uncharacterized protein (TIGR02145 family)